jgi:hypothetical protein
MLAVVSPGVEVLMKVGLVVLLLVFSGCSLQQGTPPPRPNFPEVRHVAPCDPKAVAGLTQDAVEALRSRDVMWRQHVERLERQIQGLQ